MSRRYSETIRISVNGVFGRDSSFACGSTLPGSVFAVTIRGGVLSLTHKPTGFAAAAGLTSFNAGQRAAAEFHRLPVDWAKVTPEQIKCWPEELRAKARAIRREAEGNPA
jgi:hypothetical protein